MKLVRTEQTDYATYGQLVNDDGTVAVTVTLEPSPPDLLVGTFPCRRYFSPHFQVELFRVYDVPGHDAIELHVGNSASDTHGCVLLGTAREGKVITQSRLAFSRFMAAMGGTDSFDLEVVAP